MLPRNGKEEKHEYHTPLVYPVLLTLLGGLLLVQDNQAAPSPPSIGTTSR
jgi:hypothetical protein